MTNSVLNHKADRQQAKRVKGLGHRAERQRSSRRLGPNIRVHTKTAIGYEVVRIRDGVVISK